MRFEKWHGIGNDFVMVADPKDEIELSPDQVKDICDRRFGVGADGVIRVAPGTEGADLFMDYVNSDGTLGEMCGNGIRCLAVFAREQGMADKDELKVLTRAGMKTVTILDDGRVRVDMGPPVFRPSEIPIGWDEDNALHVTEWLMPDGPSVELTAIGMGNPHAVIFVDDLDKVDVAHVGPQIEQHHLFPNGANVEWARVDSPDHVSMVVWERGSGQTLACGTGACAVAVAAKLIGGAGDNVTVSLPGGDLEVEWSGTLDEEAPVFMTGPAERSFKGEL